MAQLYGGIYAVKGKRVNVDFIVKNSGRGCINLAQRKFFPKLVEYPVTWLRGLAGMWEDGG